jgi:gluconolactonase
MNTIFQICAILMLIACQGNKGKEKIERKTIGTVERIHTGLDKLIDPTAKIEVIAEGFAWSEGPLWVEEHQLLLFSDVPNNKVYKWSETQGLKEYLKLSGYTGKVERGGEKGSNGLLLDRNGNLVLCQHGNRQVAQMDAPLVLPKSRYISLANKFNGKKLNSPNDIIQRSNGDLFFTDPPYGLNDQETEKKELSTNGVYKLDTLGTLTLLIDTLSRPNGLALSPNEKKLIIGNSDSKKPMLFAYNIDVNDSLTPAGIVFNFQKYGGAPDGFKIDQQGNIFASGPGGIWIFNNEYILIGKIKLPQAVSNCCLADGGKTLYITAAHQVLRLRMR